MISLKILKIVSEYNINSLCMQMEIFLSQTFPDLRLEKKFVPA